MVSAWRSEPRNRDRRRGLTLAELLVATTIMLMIATAVGTLASAVHSTNDFCRGYTVAAQHARVALSRIERTLKRPCQRAVSRLPRVTEQAGSQALPSTLVVWSPTGTAANPTGLPLISEIVVFGPDPAHPNNLLEIRSPTETSSRAGSQRYVGLANAHRPAENQLCR